MTRLDEINLMNQSMLLYLKKMNLDYKRNRIISKVLEDKACFFKISKDEAYTLLRSVGVIDEKIDDLYLKLISRNEYYSLQKQGIIDEFDKELVIKYERYNPDEMFKNKSNSNAETMAIQVMKPKKNVFKKLFKRIKTLFHK